MFVHRPHLFFSTFVFVVTIPCLQPLGLFMNSLFFRISRMAESGPPIPCYKSEVAQVRIALLRLSVPSLLFQYFVSIFVCGSQLFVACFCYRCRYPRRRRFFPWLLTSRDSHTQLNERDNLSAFERSPARVRGDDFPLVPVWIDFSLSAGQREHALVGDRTAMFLNSAPTIDRLMKSYTFFTRRKLARTSPPLFHCQVPLQATEALASETHPFDCRLVPLRQVVGNSVRWKQTEVGLPVLANGDLHRPLVVEVFGYKT